MGRRTACGPLGWVACLLAFPAQAYANPLDFFEKEVRPLLVKRCYSCHSTEGKQRGGLRLDDKSGLQTGGDTGPALKPGHPDQSLLMQAVRYRDSQLKMPPSGKLPEAEIDVLTRWIAQGAPDPRVDAGAKTTAKKNAGLDHWSFQPPRAQPIPPVRNETWPRTSIDRFVLARLEKEKLEPVADADKLTLLRRVTLDLTGLPPTTDEIDAFLKDDSPEAWDKVVDRLLASRHYAERWARHWMDVARFAETTGSTNDLFLPDAWRYRDYLIDAFDRDLRYDRFLVEQLAGDLLPSANPSDRDRGVIATGFLALTLYDFDKPDEGARLEQIDEQIDVTTRAFLGLTVACARCHDHKYDPIPTTDYYALAGIFSSTEIRKMAVYTKGKHTLIRVSTGAPLEGYEQKPVDEFIRLQEDLYGGRQAVVHLGWELNKLAAAWKSSQAEAEREAIASKSARLKKEIAERLATSKLAAQKLREFPPLPPMALAVCDCSRPHDQTVRIRGEIDQKGSVVPRGLPSFVPAAQKSPIEKNRSGRLELARWIASRDNPLTARVFVNRVWQQIFGQGIVPSSDNFGVSGDEPSHPELLDHLAITFMDEGWSLKSLLRRLLTSRVYRLATARHKANEEIDGDNRLLWRMSRRRLEAEVLRDALLTFTGQLDRTPAERSLIADLGVGSWRFDKEEVHFDSSKRSIYLPHSRSRTPELLALFDGADPKVLVPRRDATTVPTQALYLLNSPAILDASRQAARRLLTEEPNELRRIDRAFRLALGRPATAEESATSRKLLAQLRAEGWKTNRTIPEKGAKKAPAPSLADETPELRAWAGLCQVLIALPEFRYTP